MKDVKFVQRTGGVSETLGISDELTKAVDDFVAPMLNGNFSVADIIEAIRDKFDMDANQWTGFMFSLGYYFGCKITNHNNQA